MVRRLGLLALVFSFGSTVGVAGIVDAERNLSKVNHIIVVMQENHSFDNYFGALTATGSYHSGRCKRNDHACVDGLTCKRDRSGLYSCANSNRDADGSQVFAFHSTDYCVLTDLSHSWTGTHRQTNFD